MDSSVIDLSKYRLDTANADLKAARLLFDATEYRSSVNRSYYAIFHALRAGLALDGFDSSKHSGIISYFNLNYAVSPSKDLSMHQRTGQNSCRLLLPVKDRSIL